jgi:hypothetical protein
MPSRACWLLLLLLSVGCSTSTTSTESQRYRGDYTFGHEVNTFCPAINSQCYWLGPDTSPAVRDQLKALYQQKKPALYKPICIVVEGVIDRDTPRSGFAADTDGLITIIALEGDCDSSAAITPGDLNHRRWVLAAIDGRTVDAADPPAMLDFGELLFVEGRDGCQRFSGFAELHGNQIAFGKVEFDRSGCDTGIPEAALFSEHASWQIALRDRGGLILRNADTSLDFRRDDWR